MIYFTADTHFGHENVIRFCGRPYTTAAEMDEALIENWNSRVKGNDTVFILGDLFFRSDNAEEILRCLKGKKRWGRPFCRRAKAWLGWKAIPAGGFAWPSSAPMPHRIPMP